jgi:dimethylargininase
MPTPTRYSEDQRRFTEAIVRAPGESFVTGLTTAKLGRPDHARALRQHAAYCGALERCGLKLTRLDADERFPDSTFVEDTAVMITATTAGRKPARKQGSDAAQGRALSNGRASAIITRPGAASRVGEVESITNALSRLFPNLQQHSIHEPGTLDGGDVCEVESETENGASSHFFIGVSERTNEAGAQQLAELVASYGCTSNFVDLRGLKSILHLKSGLAYLGENRLVVSDALAHHSAFGGYELVRVKADEEYAANCIRVNDFVLVAAGYPRFEKTLQQLGYKTIALEMSEFQKLDGGLSCLSLRF